MSSDHHEVIDVIRQRSLRRGRAIDLAVEAGLTREAAEAAIDRVLAEAEAGQAAAGGTESPPTAG